MEIDYLYSDFLFFCHGFIWLKIWWEGSLCVANSDRVWEKNAGDFYCLFKSLYVMQIEYLSPLILMISFVVADILKSDIKAVRNTRTNTVMTSLF